MSEDRLLAEYQKRFGQVFGATFYKIEAHRVQLEVSWRYHEYLFGNGPEMVDMLNERAGAFFGHYQSMIFDHVLLGLSRLSDPPQSFGKTNISMATLSNHLPKSDLQPDFDEMVIEYCNRVEFARDWRNRVIAHNDYALATNQAHPIAIATRKKVRAALDSLYDCMAFLSLELDDAHIVDEIIHYADDVSLAQTIFLGNEAFAAARADRSLHKMTFPDWIMRTPAK
ncbi:MAG: hypothetical protein AAGH82_11400 [Pseudomonadota bacterium]